MKAKCFYGVVVLACVGLAGTAAVSAPLSYVVDGRTNVVGGPQLDNALQVDPPLPVYDEYTFTLTASSFRENSGNPVPAPHVIIHTGMANEYRTFTLNGVGDSITVPGGATAPRMFFFDGHPWTDNTGSSTVEIRGGGSLLGTYVVDGRTNVIGGSQFDNTLQCDPPPVQDAYVYTLTASDFRENSGNPVPAPHVIIHTGMANGYRTFTLNGVGDSITLRGEAQRMFFFDGDPWTDNTGSSTVVVSPIWDVFNMPEGYTSLETVTVGNPGNAADSTGYGAVSYEYRIGKYEVTAGQYVQFLNAVAATDTYGLYTERMDIGSGLLWSEYGCNIKRTGSPGGYSYSVAPDWANRPVNMVSWGDAARFANWLHNGQPTGAQDLTTTEDGAYYLNGATSDVDLQAVSREADAAWVIPREDEWYKAAYHKNDGATGNYWDYATSSDTTPSSDLVEPMDPGNNATFHDSTYTIGSPYWQTEVGAHENSDSPYGTFDQSGNVYEYNQAAIGSNRSHRGGQFNGPAYTLSASYRNSGVEPTYESDSHGFRVADIREKVLIGIRGDANGDRHVDLDDFVILKLNFGTGTTWSEGDSDGDRDVDLDDFVTLKNNFGKTWDFLTELPDLDCDGDVDFDDLTLAQGIYGTYVYDPCWP